MVFFKCKWCSTCIPRPVKAAQLHYKLNYSGGSYPPPPAPRTPAATSAASSSKRQTTAARLRASASVPATKDPLIAFISAAPTHRPRQPRSSSATSSDDDSDSELEDEDALECWLGEQRCFGGPKRNGLADMAIDVFTAPTTTVVVERSFSKGRRVVTKFCKSLAPSTICQILNVGFYCKYGVLRSGEYAKDCKERKAAAAKASGRTRTLQTVWKRAAEVAEAATGGKKARAEALEVLDGDEDEEEREEEDEEEGLEVAEGKGKGPAQVVDLADSSDSSDASA